MEEEKAAAYYEELTRKGEGAARFKQGLAILLKPLVLHKLQILKNKLSSNQFKTNSRRNPKMKRQREAVENRGIIGIDRDREVERGIIGSEAEAEVERGIIGVEAEAETGIEMERRRNRRLERRSRSRDRSPREGRRSEKRSDGVERERGGKDKNGSIDYSRSIEGYEKMTPAERVKARMKLQLNETAKKDEGMGSGWERFEFNKDAPLDDEEVEAVEDDAALVKHIGQSFRFSAVEARREEQLKTAHDDTMFGAPPVLASVISDNEIEMDNNRIESKDTDHASSLLNEKVLAKQQGSWRDRARKID
ncbi:hypothetical protein OIU76_022128 [Salix suchowensis]|nr:hypothetical protein OIU76_022128 [Salix suchowensis]